MKNTGTIRAKSFTFIILVFVISLMTSFSVNASSSVTGRSYSVARQTVSASVASSGTVADDTEPAKADDKVPVTRICGVAVLSDSFNVAASLALIAFSLLVIAGVFKRKRK